MLTHRNIYLHAQNVCLGFNIENGAVELPPFHSSTRMAGVSHISSRYLGKSTS